MKIIRDYCKNYKHNKWKITLEAEIVNFPDSNLKNLIFKLHGFNYPWLITLKQQRVAKLNKLHEI
jgi:hypothetical protein